MRTILFVAALVLVSPLSAQTSPASQRMSVLTGNQLLRGLDNCDRLDRGQKQAAADTDFCFLATGYVEGAANAMFVTLPKAFVERTGVQNGQVVDVVHKYLVVHPESRNDASVNLIGSALIEEWGTPESKKQHHVHETR